MLLRQETPQVFYVSDLAWLASFATFENVCYLTQNGAGQFVYLLIRGFGTGAMHIVCGSVYGRFASPDRLDGVRVRTFVCCHHLPRHL